MNRKAGKGEGSAERRGRVQGTAQAALRRNGQRLWRLGLHIAKLLALSGGLMLFAQAFLPKHMSDAPCEMHARLCGELDSAMQGGQRLLGALPREHAKTTLGTVALVLREIVAASVVRTPPAASAVGARPASPARGSGGVTPPFGHRRDARATKETDAAGRVQTADRAGPVPTERDPKQNILIIGANAQEARVKLRQVVTELESNPLLRACFGMRCAPARDKKGQLVAYTDGEIVLAGGTRISTLGFGGKVRGQLSGGKRLDLIILDDPEDDRSVESPQQRQRLRRWVDSALLNALDVHAGSLVWLGTLLHHDSVLAQLLEERGNTPGHGTRDTGHGKSLGSDPTALLTSDSEPLQAIPSASPESRVPYPGSNWSTLIEAALDDNNAPLWPGRWSYDTLMRRRAEIGSRAFAQEYLNQPQSLEEQIFSDALWQLYDPGQLALNEGRWELDGRLLRTFIGVDPAIGEDREHDYFAAAVIGLLEASDSQPERAVVIELLRHRWPYSKQLSSLSELTARWLPRAVGIESIAYQAALKQAAFELGLPAIELKGAQAKAARIETLAALVEAGRVLLPAHGAWVAQLREEASHYPSGKHDDQLDALARALETAQLMPGGGEALEGLERRSRTRGF